MSSGNRSKEEEISRGAPMTTGAPLGAPAGAFQPARYAPALEMPRRTLLCRGVGDARRSRRNGIGVVYGSTEVCFGGPLSRRCRLGLREESEEVKKRPRRKEDSRGSRRRNQGNVSTRDRGGENRHGDHDR